MARSRGRGRGRKAQTQAVEEKKEKEMVMQEEEEEEEEEMPQMDDTQDDIVEYLYEGDSDDGDEEEDVEEGEEDEEEEDEKEENNSDEDNGEETENMDTSKSRFQEWEGWIDKQNEEDEEEDDQKYAYQKQAMLQQALEMRKTMSQRTKAGAKEQKFEEILGKVSDSDGEDEEEDEEDERGPRKRARTTSTSFEALKSFQKIPLDWSESLLITTKSLNNTVDANDDLARETMFYRSAQDAAVAAIGLFKKHNMPYHRPEDFFADMIKDDRHMEKVRHRLLEQRKRIEVVEERRAQREQRKFGKQMRAEARQNKEKAKREDLEAITKWKKERKMLRNDSGAALGDDDFEIALEQWKKGSGKEQFDGKDKKQQQKTMKGKSGKRKSKDERYGFGGKKKRSKSNTAESFTDVSGWSKAKNKSLDADVSEKMFGRGGPSFDRRQGKSNLQHLNDHNKRKRKRNGGNKSNRPGKRRRQKMRG